MSYSEKCRTVADVAFPTRLSTKRVLFLVLLAGLMGLTSPNSSYAEHVYCSENTWGDKEVPEQCREFCDYCVSFLFSLSGAQGRPPGASQDNSFRAFGSGTWCEFISKNAWKCCKGAVKGGVGIVCDMVLSEVWPSTDPFHNIDCHATNLACLLKIADKDRPFPIPDPTPRMFHSTWESKLEDHPY
jgi:hypothetical protein